MADWFDENIPQLNQTGNSGDWFDQNLPQLSPEQQPQPQPSQPGILETIRQDLEPTEGEGAVSRGFKGSWRGIFGLVTSPWEILKATTEPPKTPVEAGMASIHGDIGLLAQRMVIDPAMQGFQRAGQEFKGGRYGRGTTTAVTSAIPLIGPYTNSLIDRALSGDITGAATEAITGLLLGKVTNKAGEKVTGLFNEEPASRLNRGVMRGRRYRNTEAASSAERAMPDLVKAEKSLGNPITQGDMDNAINAYMDVIKKSKIQVWADYAEKLNTAETLNAKIDGNSIANAMVDSIPPNVLLENPALVKSIKKKADAYRRSFNIPEMEGLLQSVNKELMSYYKKNRIDRRGAEGNPKVAWKVAQADALRDALYSKLDELTGEGSAEIKRRYGALLNLEREAITRQVQLQGEAPINLAQNIGAFWGLTRILKSVIDLKPRLALEGIGELAITQKLKKLNSTNYMIQKAFEDAMKEGGRINLSGVPQKTFPILQGIGNTPNPFYNGGNP